MADTTNDIWNDRDGEREAPPKRHILRNFLIFLLVLIAVLGVVLAAAWRDGTGFDVLRRYFAYGTVSGAGDKTGFQFDADNSNRFAEIGNGGLVILSDTSIRLLSAGWQRALERQYPDERPRADQRRRACCSL